LKNRVSVIIPTYNGSKTIVRAINSVLQQTYTNYEIIIVDDGSTDETVDIVKENFPSITILKQQNQGTMSARQAGINVARGDLIALLDQDDYWSTEKLQIQVELLKKNPDVGLVLANMKAFDDQNNLLEFNVVPVSKCFSPSWEELLILHPISTSSAIFRKSIVTKIGGLDTSFGFSGALGDSDTFIRMSEITKVRFIDEIVGYYFWSEMRPGRLVSFLDNLQIYARKYWNHPNLLGPDNLELRSKFVRSCCNYALYIYRLLLEQYNNKIPFEMLQKLNNHHQLMGNLFGDLYSSEIKLKSINFGVIKAINEYLNTALFIYLLRSDLQALFPEVINGDIVGFLKWTFEVANGRLSDIEYKTLKGFTPLLKQEIKTSGSTTNSLSKNEGFKSEYHEKEKISKRSDIKSRSVNLLILTTRKVLPYGSKRRGLCEPVLRGVKILITEGWVSFWQKSIHYIRNQSKINKINANDLNENKSIHLSTQNPDVAGNELNKALQIATPSEENLLKSKINFLLSDPEIRLTIPKFQFPIVSIVINLVSNRQAVYECLESLIAYSNIPYRIVAAYGTHSPETKILLDKIDNISIIDNLDRQDDFSMITDFVHRQIGSEKYILIMSSETVVLSGYLDQMLKLIESDDLCGAVGCKIISPYGLLLEAGGIEWDDNNRSSYGFNDSPNKPEYSYVRQVDFCSSDCLLIKKELLNAILINPQLINNFDVRDICKIVRDQGYKVKYQPTASVINSNYRQFDLFQSNSSNLDTLREETPNLNDESNQNMKKSNYDIFISRDATKGKRILVLDDYIPAIRYGSGFPRLYEMLSCLAELNYAVTFLPVGNAVKAQPETAKLQQKGIEVFWDIYANFEKFVQDRCSYYDVVLISRPHVFERIIPIAKRYFPEAAILYDAEALFCAREILKAEVNGKELRDEEKSRMLLDEMKLIEKADLVISVSSKIKDIMLKNSAQKNIGVWEHVQDTNETKTPFEHRHNILIFGSFFAGVGSPNEDAALYFAQEVFPLVRTHLSCKLFIVGTNPTPAINNLAASDIIVTGYVENLQKYSDECRINVIPTRFTAGVPLKLLEAMSYGIPTVVSTLVADQINLIDQEQVLIANNTKEFAEKVIRLYSDEELWKRIKRNSLAYVENNFSKIRMRDKLRLIIERGLEIEREKKR
jgi:O-antigen biosynthesis protein